MPRGLENSIIDFLRSLYGSVGWLGVFLAMTIESAAIPIPSEVIMPLAGWFLIKDQHHAVWYVVIAGIVGALGCVLGSIITYGIGAAGGRPLLMRYGKFILISPHHIEVADRWFEEKGEATAFVSRLLPVVRTFISLPAGVARMHLPRFIVYTLAGSFIWCTALALGGYYAGANWEHFRNVLRPFDYPVAAIVVILIVLFIVRGRQSHDRAQVEARN